MKGIRFLLFLLCCSLGITSATAQNHSQQEVIYLKNGSVIRGTVVEQTIGQSIKVRTADGSLFVYNQQEIEKIVKEKESNNNFQPFRKAEKKSYIGIGLGATYTFDAEEFGFQLNLIDFGYLFNENIGIAAKLQGKGYSVNAHSAHMSDDSGTLTITTLTAGPLLSFQSGNKGRFEIKPMVGFGAANLKIDNISINSDTKLAFGLDIQYRYHISRVIDLFAALGYSKISDYSDINLLVGVGLRL